MGWSNVGNLVGNMVPKTASCGLLGGKWSPKRRRVGFLGGKWSLKRHRVGHLGGNSWSERRRTEASSTRLSLFSLFKTETETETNLLNSHSSPTLHGFLLQTSPRTLKHSSQTLKHSSQTLKHPQRGHSFAPVDTTAEGTKKQSSKEKDEFTFPFSSVFLFYFIFCEFTFPFSSVCEIFSLWFMVVKCGQC